MSEIPEKSGAGRLEDFIKLAGEGKDVSAEIGLRKEAVTQRVHPDETSGMEGEIEMFLLIGDFTFKAGSETQRVSKVYMFGSRGESQDAARVDRHVANERLKTDYRRLRNANIKFEEKYF